MPAIVVSRNMVLAYSDLDDRFVAHLSGLVRDKENGTEWKNATVAVCSSLPDDISYQGYEYHAGKFIPCAPYVVLKNTPMTEYTIDETTYTVVEQNGVYLAFKDGQSTTYVKRSVDGVNWESVESIPFSGVVGIAAGSGVFVACCYSSSTSTNSKSNAAAYSADGLVWTATTLPSVDCRSALCGGDGLFSCVKADGFIEYSNDGITWKSGGYVSIYSVTPVYANGSVLFITGDNGIGNSVYVVFADGTTKKLADGSDFDLNSRNRFCVVFWDGALVFSAGINIYITMWDGENLGEREWHNIGTGFSKLRLDRGRIIGLLSGTTTAKYSGDGVTWDTVQLPYTLQTWENLQYFNGVFRVIGTNGAIAESSDFGATWTFGGRRLLLPNGLDITDDIREALKI